MIRPMFFLCLSLLISGITHAGNLVLNPGFDGNPNWWTHNSDPDVVATYSTEDASGNPASGSVSVTNVYSGAGIEMSGYWQCIAVEASAEYAIGATVKIDSGQGISGDGGVTVYWFENPGCSTYVSGLSVDSDLTDQWTSILSFNTAPATAQSARVYVKVYKLDAGGSLNALIDDVLFLPVIFQDGFESGDMTAWSATFP